MIAYLLEWPVYLCTHETSGDTDGVVVFSAEGYVSLDGVGRRAHVFFLLVHAFVKCFVVFDFSGRSVYAAARSKLPVSGGYASLAACPQSCDLLFGTC